MVALAPAQAGVERLLERLRAASPEGRGERMVDGPTLFGREPPPAR